MRVKSVSAVDCTLFSLGYALLAERGSLWLDLNTISHTHQNYQMTNFLTNKNFSKLFLFQCFGAFQQGRQRRWRFFNPGICPDTFWHLKWWLLISYKSGKRIALDSFALAMSRCKWGIVDQLLELVCLGHRNYVSYLNCKEGGSLQASSSQCW